MRRFDGAHKRTGRISRIETLEARHLLAATPTTVSVTPNSATVSIDTPTLLTARYADADGNSDIRLAELRVSDGYSNVPRCFVRYDQLTNLLKLYNNATSSLVTVGAPGSANSVSVAECTLNAATSSVSVIDTNTIDVSLDLSFTSSIQGTRNIWLRAFDNSGAWSTIDDRGDLTIVDAPPQNQPPTTVSISPNNAFVEKNTAIALAARYSDVDGQADLQLGELQVADTYGATPRCYVTYDFNADELKLYDDATSSFISAGAPGTGTTVSNAECALDAANSSVVSVDANTAEVTFDLQFTQNLVGTFNLWLRADDDLAQSSTTDDQGDITVTDAPPANQPPVTVSVSPANPTVNTSTPIALTGRYSDVDGVADLQLAELQVAGTYDTAPRCFVVYDFNANDLQLYDDATSSFVSAGAPGSGSSVANADCTLDAAASVVANVDANTADVTFNLSFTQTLDGTSNLWLRADDDSAASSSTDDRGDITINHTPAPPTAPATVSVVPSSSTVGTSTPIVLAARYSDVNGVNDLRLAELRVSDGYTNLPRCFARYDALTNLLKLYDNATASLVTVGAPGSSNSVSIAECTLDAAISSISIVDGVTMDVSFGLSFTSVSAGSRNIWMRAFDKTGRWSSIDDRGDITIVDGPPPNQAPATVSVTPSNATVDAGTAIALTARYSDANGASDLQLGELQVAGSYGAAPRCYVTYDFNTNDLQLYDDATTSFISAGAPGTGTPVANTECSLDPAASSVTTIDANSIDVAFDLTFTQNLVGTPNIWLRADDDQASSSSTDDRGDITVNSPPANQLPTTVSVTPSNATITSGIPIAMTARYVDSDGVGDLKLGELQVAGSYGTTPRCLAVYDFNANDLQLYNDATSSFVSAGAPGSGTQVSNSECTLDAAASSVTTVDANTADVTFDLEFTQNLLGTFNLWLRADDDQSATSTTDDRGDITINAPSGNQAPVTVSVTPSVSSVDAGTALALTARYADADGSADLAVGEIQVASTYDTAPRCYAMYDFNADDLQLYDDATSSFVSAGSPGSGGSVSNAACTLDAAASSVTTVDANTLDVTFNLKFTINLTGSHEVWLKAEDDSLATSAVNDRGDLTVTPPPPTPPTTVSVSPNDVSVALDTQILLTGRYADVNGTDDIRLAELRVSDGYSSVPRCYVRYDYLTNLLKLYNNATSSLITVGAPGSANSVSVADCTLHAATSSVAVVDASTLDVTLDLEFTSVLEGANNIWMRAYDDTGQWSTIDDRGDIQIGPVIANVVDGYTDKQSYDQNEQQLVYINALQTALGARIDLYDESANVVDSLLFNAEPQTSPNANPAVDGYAYNLSFSFNIGSLPSGLYWWGNKIPFVVKDTSQTSKIRVVLPTHTMNAYSCTGGVNLYTVCPGGQVDFVHFDRQLQSVAHTIPATSEIIRRDTGGWSSPFFWWIEQQIGNLGTTYGVLADSDLEDPLSLTGADVLVLPGHSEYWTRTARENVDAFIDAGGDLASLSGNTMWWQSRLENDQLVVYKSLSEDPIQDPLLKTINWDHPSLAYPIIDTLGADFQFGGYIDQNPPGGAPASFNGYKVVAENSPLLEGTNLLEGDIIDWDTDLIFSEYDGPPVSGVDANGYPIVDNAVLGFHQVELVAFDNAYRLDPGFGTLLAFQRTPTSGYVVNAGTMLWAYEMTKSPEATTIQTITFNILDKLLNDAPIFSPPPPPPPALSLGPEISLMSTPLNSTTRRADEAAVDQVFTELGEYVAPSMTHAAASRNARNSLKFSAFPDRQYRMKFSSLLADTAEDIVVAEPLGPDLGQGSDHNVEK